MNNDFGGGGPPVEENHGLAHASSGDHDRHPKEPGGCEAAQPRQAAGNVTESQLGPTPDRAEHPPSPSSPQRRTADWFKDPRMKDAERFSWDAEGANISAGRLYEAVAREMPTSQSSTRSAIAVAAVVCFTRAAKWHRALKLARFFLTQPGLTLRGRTELTDIIARAPVTESIDLDDNAENHARSALEQIIAERNAYRERWRASTPSNPAPTVHDLLIRPEFLAGTALIRYAPGGGSLDRHHPSTHILVGIDTEHGTFLQWQVRHAAAATDPAAARAHGREPWEDPAPWHLTRHILAYPALLVPASDFAKLELDR